MASSKAVLVTLLLTCKKVPTGEVELLQLAANLSEMLRSALSSPLRPWVRLLCRHSDSRLTQYLHHLPDHRLVSTSHPLRCLRMLQSLTHKTGTRHSRTRTGFTMNRRRHHRADHRKPRSDRRRLGRPQYHRRAHRRRRTSQKLRDRDTRLSLKKQRMASLMRWTLTPEHHRRRTLQQGSCQMGQLPRLLLQPLPSHLAEV
jgi:hypothetical protein